ncbi:MAG: glycosyltransferase family 4 protein [Patescibacteria group bacterium]
MKYIGIDCREIEEKQTGIGNYTKSLISEIVKEDKNNVYYLIFNKNNIFLKYKERYLKYKNVKVVSIFSKTQNPISEITLPFELKKLKLDLFWTHIWGSVYYPGVNYVLSLHDIIGVKRKDFVSLKYRIYNALHLKWTVKHASLIFVPTKAVKDDIIKYLKIRKDHRGMGSKRIKVTGEGLTRLRSTGNTTLDSETFESISKKYEIKNPYFIYVGNERPHKNIEGLVKTFISFKKKYKNGANLILCGVSKDNSYIRKRNKSYIKALGYVSESEKFALLENAVAFVTLSFDEGFGLPLLEATASGCPIICSDITVFREIIGDDGAIFVDPYRIRPVAKSMNLLYSDSTKRDDLVREAKRNLERFSWTKTAKRILKYLR